MQLPCELTRVFTVILSPFPDQFCQFSPLKPWSQFFLVSVLYIKTYIDYSRMWTVEYPGRSAQSINLTYNGCVLCKCACACNNKQRRYSAEIFYFKNAMTSAAEHFLFPVLKRGTNYQNKSPLWHLYLPCNVTSRHFYLGIHFRTLLLIYDTSVDLVVTWIT